ncbi:MAG: transglycosylase SLT domain-containing protein, partial [Actinomycetota bacterium]
AGGTYTVRPGDTLAAIAARAGTTADALARLNGIRDPNLVVAGAVLRTPGGAATVAAARPAPAWVDPSQVQSLLARHAARHGVSLALARAVAWQESGFRQDVVSSAGAVGVMQLMPDTAAWAGPALLGRAIDPASADDNIDAGVAFLAYLLRRTGDPSRALAGYNQGLDSVARNGVYQETRQYVASVLALTGRV